MLVYVDEGGNSYLFGFYKKRGVFCSSVECNRHSGLSTVFDPIVADSLIDLLLKIHARFGCAIEKIDPEEIYCEEGH